MPWMVIVEETMRRMVSAGEKVARQHGGGCFERFCSALLL